MRTEQGKSTAARRCGQQQRTLARKSPAQGVAPAAQPPNPARFEWKYRLVPRQALAIRNAIAPFMRSDAFTDAARPQKGYFVRSLYFETWHHALYAQKSAGDYARVKYRFRVYCADASSAPPVRVEMKVRRGEALAKYHAFVPFDAYQSFLSHGEWAGESNAILETFAHGVHAQGLRPCVLVDYWREGFAARQREDVRLTFDHGVRSSHADVLFPPAPLFPRIHHPHEIVLEIKHRDSPPLWLLRIIRAFGLRLVANSKFSQGVEAARYDRIYSGRVLVVR